MALQTRAEATPSGTRGVKRNKHLPCPGWSQAGYCRRSFMEKLPTSFKALRYLPFLVASAFFMQMLDATILNTAIPTIARSFNSHPLQLHSLVTAYTLTVCVLIPGLRMDLRQAGLPPYFPAGHLCFFCGVPPVRPFHLHSHDDGMPRHPGNRAAPS